MKDRTTKVLVFFVLLLIIFSVSLWYNTAEAEAPAEVPCEHISDIKKYAQCRVNEKWDNQWKYFDFILNKESGWCYTKWNRMTKCPDVAPRKNPTNGSNAFGLCQTMMTKHNVPKKFFHNPYMQVDWCIDYAEQRYKTPENGWKFHIVNNYW